MHLIRSHVNQYKIFIDPNLNIMPWNFILFQALLRNVIKILKELLVLFLINNSCIYTIFNYYMQNTLIYNIFLFRIVKLKYKLAPILKRFMQIYPTTMKRKCKKRDLLMLNRNRCYRKLIKRNALMSDFKDFFPRDVP